MEAKAEMKDYRFRASIKTGRKGDHAIVGDACVITRSSFLTLFGITDNVYYFF